ncbi:MULTISPECIES: conjugal transfer protein TraQ [Pseudomonas]|uniref:conjugal transfer protein TraQ n=1 Tax=Pseudomonas TaxID=286 RepID=UPI000EF69441|nr:MULTISPECIES: conjugal transfer protein TraQ [Pseudomonas]AYN18971.1 conjugal transfer protein TraQ [Pseudomonas monteilii]MCE1038508.1 conjugal transfer protein TraQ [Pseudomonas monteilii]MCL8328759.1 conjugal transfer protein TraQ [Pseudomonas juntendi]MDD2061444.1 conjugal transfer protein TraQ [Pseudomonas putida]UJW25442.1 conjugal transfer protein TraQ [Pseudomonas juntendi]
MDLASMIISAANSLVAALWALLWSLSALAGMVYAGSVLRRMQLATIEPGHRPITLGSTFAVLVIGAALFNMPGMITATWNSYGSGATTYGAISYSGAENFGKFKEAVNAVLTLAAFAGGCFFFKGLLLMKKAVIEGEGSQGADDAVWRGLTHMIFGAALTHVDKVIEAFQATFKLYW